MFWCPVATVSLLAERGVMLSLLTELTRGTQSSRGSRSLSLARPSRHSSPGAARPRLSCTQQVTLSQAGTLTRSGRGQEVRPMVSVFCRYSEYLLPDLALGGPPSQSDPNWWWPWQLAQ